MEKANHIKKRSEAVALYFIHVSIKKKSFCILTCVSVCVPSPVLLWLWLAFHGSEKGGGQLALLSHLQTWVAHFDVDDGEILQNT